MNLVFLNSLEKKAGDGRVVMGQVSICEDKGAWRVYWNEPREDGKSAQNCWFDGQRWEDMLHAFREGIKAKASEGYTPLLKEVFVVDPAFGKMNFSGMLQYYSETRTDGAVYEALRRWRRERALKEGKSPFIIATNSMLRMISAFLPHTVDELRQIPGWGKQKASLYGEDVLRITGTVHRSTSFPLDWVASEVSLADFQRWMEDGSKHKERVQQQKRHNKKKLLEGIMEGRGLNSLQQELSLRRNDLLQLVEELDRDGYDVQPLVEAELKSVSGEQRRLAWQAFEQEGDRYLKPVVQRMFPDGELPGKDPGRLYEWLRLLRLKYRKDKSNASSP